MFSFLFRANSPRPVAENSQSQTSNPIMEKQNSFAEKLAPLVAKLRENNANIDKIQKDSDREFDLFMTSFKSRVDKAASEK